MKTKKGNIAPNDKVSGSTNWQSFEVWTMWFHPHFLYNELNGFTYFNRWHASHSVFGRLAYSVGWIFDMDF